MVEIEQHGIVFDLLHRTGITALVVRRRKLDHFTDGVSRSGFAELIQQLTRHPLQHIRITFTESFTGRHFQLDVLAFCQTQQTRFYGRCQLGVAQRQGGRRAVKRVDDVTLRSAQAVVQCQK